MEKEKNFWEGTRKKRSPKGQTSQRMFNFRLDNELFAWLDTIPNKGRYLNNLIREDIERKSKVPSDLQDELN